MSCHSTTFCMPDSGCSSLVGKRGDGGLSCKMCCYGMSICVPALLTRHRLSDPLIHLSAPRPGVERLLRQRVMRPRIMQDSIRATNLGIRFVARFVHCVSRHESGVNLCPVCAAEARALRARVACRPAVWCLRVDLRVCECTSTHKPAICCVFFGPLTSTGLSCARSLNALETAYC